MKKEYKARLVFTRRINKDSSLLTFDCPEIAVSAIPGHFVNISCHQLLKRPFGVCETDPERGYFSIGVRVVGEGTRDICSYEPGQEVDVLGPLGNPFPVDGIKKLILVGGGTGVYPLYFALSHARSNKIPTLSVLGFRSSEETCLIDEFKTCADQFIVTSDKGDIGIHGNVLDALEGLGDDEISEATVFTVGPDIMMKRVSEWAFMKGLSCYVSLERRMACGVGMCLVCTCKIKSPKEDHAYDNKRCCADGPVFDAREVIW